MKGVIKFWFILFIAFVLIGVRIGSSGLLLASLLSVNLLGLAYLWSELTLRKISVSVDLGVGKIFAGEDTELTLEITNAKVLPVFWLTLIYYYPPGMNLKGGQYISPMPGNRKRFKDSFNIGLYQKIIRRYQVSPLSRGVYQLSNGQILTEGFIGLFSRDKLVASSVKLTVYPKLYPLEKNFLQAAFPRGDKMGEGWIMVDPINRAGVRDYQPTDKWKQINWKVSARHHKLKSDIYHPSFSQEIELIFDVRTAQYSWQGVDTKLMEKAYSLTASLARELYDRGAKVGITSNGKAEAGSGLRLKPSCTPGHLEQILTGLASLQPYYNKDIETYAAQFFSAADKIIITTYPEGLELKPNIFATNKETHVVALQKSEEINLNFPGKVTCWTAGLKEGDAGETFEFKPV